MPADGLKLPRSCRIAINDNSKTAIAVLGMTGRREKEPCQIFKGYSFLNNQTLFRGGIKLEGMGRKNRLPASRYHLSIITFNILI